MKNFEKLKQQDTKNPNIKEEITEKLDPKKKINWIEIPQESLRKRQEKEFNEMLDDIKKRVKEHNEAINEKEKPKSRATIPLELSKEQQLERDNIKEKIKKCYDAVKKKFKELTSKIMESGKTVVINIGGFILSGIEKIFSGITKGIYKIFTRFTKKLFRIDSKKK